MIRSIIIDDEKKSRDVLDKMIARYLPDKVQVVSKLSSVSDAIDTINNDCPDLVFLDIHLNDKSGLELLYHYENANLFGVIFVTGYTNYAIDAVRHNAIDYILKPVNMIDLVSAVNRFEKKKFENQLISNSKNNDSSQKSIKITSIAFPTKSGFKLEEISTILYCEAKGNYSNIHLYDNRQIIVSKTLKKVVEMIDHFDFFRIHKSFYLNMSFISSYNRAENLVELKNGSFLPVSVRKNDLFVKKLLGRN